MEKGNKISLPEEIVIISKTDSERAPSTLDKIEKLAKIASTIAIPLIIAGFGWLYQNILNDKNLNRDYVNISLAILTDENKDIDHRLREWAVDLLAENSPTKFDKSTLEQLKSGAINLPSTIGESILSLSNSGTLASSSDGKYFASGQEDGTIKIYETQTGNLKSELLGHDRPITCIAFSPDAKSLLSGSLDNTLKLWDLNGMLITDFQSHTDAIKGIAYSADGKSFLTSSWDGTILKWSLDGRLLNKIELK